MNKKGIICILLILCLALCSCSKKSVRSLKKYRAYSLESDYSGYDLCVSDIVYNADKDECELPEIHTTRKKNMSDKQVTFGSESVNFSYDSTSNKQYCSTKEDNYRNEETGIEVSFRENSDDLVFFTAGEFEYRIYDGLIDSESKLLEVCSSYLADKIDSFDSYKADITSLIRSKNGKGGNKSSEGFVSPNEYEDSSIRYKVNLVHYIGELKTGDAIRLEITQDGLLGLFISNMIGEFDSFDDIKIDVEQCENLISSKVAEMCDIEGYKYNGYTDSKILMVLDGRLVMLIYVEPDLEDVNGIEKVFAPDITLVIPLS